jgi:RHS repeat-associated protein
MIGKIKKITLGFFGTVLCGQMAQAEVSYFHSDHLGSTTVGTNSAGNVQQAECYTPFGEILTPHLSSSPQRGEERGEGATLYLFTNQELDRSSDLYYYGARYYDPSLAQFIGVDAIRQYENPYAYSANNPVRFFDIDGNIYLGSFPREQMDLAIQAAYETLLRQGGARQIQVTKVDPKLVATIADGANVSGINHFGYNFGDDQLRDLERIMTLHPELVGDDVIVMRYGIRGSDEFVVITDAAKMERLGSIPELGPIFKFEAPKGIGEVTAKGIAGAFGKEFPWVHELRGQMLGELAEVGDGGDLASALRRAGIRAEYGKISKGFELAAKMASKVTPGVSGVFAGIRFMKGDIVGGALNIAGEAGPVGPFADGFSVLWEEAYDYEGSVMDGYGDDTPILSHE